MHRPPRNNYSPIRQSYDRHEYAHRLARLYCVIVWSLFGTMLVIMCAMAWNSETVGEVQHLVLEESPVLMNTMTMIRDILQDVHDSNLTEMITAVVASLADEDDDGGFGD